MINIKQIYESLILEAMTLMEIWEKFYSKEITDFSLFDQLDSMDPTHTSNKKGKYLDWIVRHAFKNNKNILEDFTKVKENLEIFDKNQRKIGKQISQIKDQYELAKLVEEFKLTKSYKGIDLVNLRKDIDVLYNDADWIILSPKTEEASIYYGKDTEWCTANTNPAHNYFKRYDDDGPLYIVINKNKPSEKYQFHFESKQYMDKDDTPISPGMVEEKIPVMILDKILN